MTSLNQLSLYKNIQEKLLGCADMEGCIEYGRARIKVSYFRIPKKLITRIIKEMEEMGMIERVSKKNGCKLKIVA